MLFGKQKGSSSLLLLHLKGQSRAQGPTAIHPLCCNLLAHLTGLGQHLDHKSGLHFLTFHTAKYSRVMIFHLMGLSGTFCL